MSVGLPGGLAVHAPYAPYMYHMLAGCACTICTMYAMHAHCLLRKSCFSACWLAHRIVFTTLHKYDGVETRPLSASEIKQIAGR
jgi:hypothetical protein